MAKWPLLQKLVEEGVLLSIDLAYAETQATSQKEAAVHAALIALARQGHLSLTKENVAALSPQLASLIDGPAQLPKYAQLEQEIAQEIHRLLSYPQQKLESIPTTALTFEQQAALNHACTYPLSLITGGPGTGKTYTAAHIVKNLRTPTLLAAPTGKAAAHLESKVTEPVRAGTLHSLLRGGPLDAHLVIVDECSMIDPQLFLRLLKAIDPQTHLILMGDVDQLPAVEGGSIFADLIDANRIPTTHLTQSMRSDRSEILTLANAILNGEAGDFRTLDLGFSTNDIKTITQKLWKHTKNLFPKDWIKEPTSFQILSTLRKGPLGVDSLNAFFYEKFAPLTNQFPIIITRNDPRTGLCNGDTGILTPNKAVFKERSFSPQELPSYEYAYCLSVHKSQGSEYDHVLFLVPDGSEAFGREVLYTAITRAKNTLEIDGNPIQMARALSRSSRKASNLMNKLNKN